MNFITQLQKKKPKSTVKQFGFNAISNTFVFGMNLLISFLLTPFLIRNLGIASYGMVPLVNSIYSYLSIFVLSINGAVGRFLIIDLQNKNDDGANRTFNTSFFGSLFMNVALLPIILFIVITLPKIFKIPSGQEISTKFLFFFVLSSFLIITIDSCFSVSSWAKNRFDLRSIVAIVSGLSRVGITILLITILSPSVWQVGLGIFLSTIIALFGDWINWKKLTPNLKVKFAYFDKNRINELFGMGGWMTINQIGTLLFTNIDLIVANLVLGATLTGEYGSILIFSSFLRGLSNTVTGALLPIMVMKFAGNDINTITTISSKAIRLLGLIFGLFVGILSGFGRPLLILWLGNDFAKLWPILILLIGHLPINLSITPLYGIEQVFNKVKIPAIVTLILGSLNIVLSIIFAKYLGWGLIGIAGSGAIILTLKNLFFTIIYSTKIQGAKWNTYINAIIPGIIATIIIGIVSWIFTEIININHWSILIGICFVIFIFFATIIFFFILRKEERKILVGILGINS